MTNFFFSPVTISGFLARIMSNTLVNNCVYKRKSEMLSLCPHLYKINYVPLKTPRNTIEILPFNSFWLASGKIKCKEGDKN